MKVSHNWQPHDSRTFPNLVDATIANGVSSTAAKPGPVQFFIYDAAGRRLRIEMTADEVASLYETAFGVPAALLKQESLGPVAEKVLMDNLPQLYSTDDAGVRKD